MARRLQDIFGVGGQPTFQSTWIGLNAVVQPWLVSVIVDLGTIVSSSQPWNVFYIVPVHAMQSARQYTGRVQGNTLFLILFSMTFGFRTVNFQATVIYIQLY